MHADVRGATRRNGGRGGEWREMETERERAERVRTEPIN
jgi:hypothetical protein